MHVISHGKGSNRTAGEYKTNTGYTSIEDGNPETNGRGSLDTSVSLVRSLQNRHKTRRSC